MTSYLPVLSEKGTYSKRREFAPIMSKFMSFRGDPLFFLERREKNWTELCLVKVYLFPKNRMRCIMRRNMRKWHLCHMQRANAQFTLSSWAF